jgi:hypothetical protein
MITPCAGNLWHFYYVARARGSSCGTYEKMWAIYGHSNTGSIQPPKTQRHLQMPCERPGSHSPHV